MTQKIIGTVRVDSRGRVYLKRLAKDVPEGALYLLSAEPETDGSAPKTIKLKLVE